MRLMENTRGRTRGNRDSFAEGSQRILTAVILSNLTSSASARITRARDNDVIFCCFCVYSNEVVMKDEIKTKIQQKIQRRKKCIFPSTFPFGRNRSKIIVSLQVSFLQVRTFETQQLIKFLREQHVNTQFFIEV